MYRLPGMLRHVYYSFLLRVVPLLRERLQR
jgi:hypothetical protein